MINKVCFYISSFTGGGAERENVYLANELSKRGYAVDLVVSKGTGPLKELVEPSVNCICLGVPLAAEPFVFAKYIYTNKPQTIISSLTVCNIIAALSRLFYLGKVKIVWRVVSNLSNARAHNAGSRLLRYAPRIYRYLSFVPSRIVCVSKGVADDLSQQHELPAHKLLTIYNPAYSPVIHQMARENVSDTMFSSSESDFRFITVGRLTRAKAFEKLITAFSNVVQSYPNCSLSIVGDGELRAELVAQAEELNISDQVHFWGFQINPYKYLARANCFVLSSDYEGFGNVLIEAMALNIPVISTDCESGPAEILEGGKLGTLVPVGDVDALSKAMASEIQQRRIVDTLSAAKNYSVENIATMYEQLI